jgi:dTDP-4-amino-4,6-dideoxygalactose transaminase
MNAGIRLVPAGVTDAASILRLFQEVARADKVILGSRAQAFEAGLGARLTARAIGCAGHVGALVLALRAVGVERGDQVVVPAFAGGPAAAAAIAVGAEPLWADVAPAGTTVSPEAVERLGRRARAVVAVHAGAMADMPALAAASSHGLRVVEDVGRGLGAALAGRAAGTWGEAAAVDLTGGCLRAPGEAGAVVTGDAEVERRCRLLRNHGQDGVHRFLHHEIGLNCRMDEVVAGSLVERLPLLDATLARRREVAARYAARLGPAAGAGLALAVAGEATCPDGVVVLTPRRDLVRDLLAERGVETGLVQAQPPPGDLLHAARACREHLVLPAHELLTDADVELIADTVLAAHA